MRKDLFVQQIPFVEKVLRTVSVYSCCFDWSGNVAWPP
jgi:hypothetical protein